MKLNYMQFLPVIIVLEVILSSFLITLPVIKNHSIKHLKVLGVTKLAQEDTGNSAGDNTNNSTAQTDQSSTTNPEESPSPTDNPSTDQSTQSQEVISPNPEESASPVDVNSNSEQNSSSQSSNSPNPGGEQNLSSPQETSLPQPPKEELTSPITGENATGPTSESEIIPSSVSTALDPTEAISNSKDIDPNVIKQVEEQNKQAQQAITPDAQVQTSITSGNQDVSVINSALAKDNFTNVSLITQDLSQRIDRSLNALNQASPQQSSRLKQEFASFCLGADTSLRSAEEMVPEELEQDIEINRAKCLNTTSQQ